MKKRFRFCWYLFIKTRFWNWKYDSSKRRSREAVWVSRGNLNRMVLEDSFAISVSYYYDMFMKQLDMFAGRENELKNVE